MTAAFEPAFWGMGGAFIYAGPRWIIALRGAGGLVITTLDLLICLCVGAVGAAAFGPILGHVALTVFRVKDETAACVVVGLFLNSFAPSLVEKGSSALDTGSATLVRVLEAIRGTSEK